VAAKGEKKYGIKGGCASELLEGLTLPPEVANSLAELGNLGVAKSTWNSYKSAKQMLLKCALESKTAMQLPLIERQILIFIDWLARVRGLRSTTINTYLSGIRQLHIVQGIDPPVFRTGLVKLVLKGITNRDGIASRSEHLTGRLPMTMNAMLLLKKLITKFDIPRQDRALFWAVATLAFAGAFRISELLCKTESTYDPDFDLLTRNVKYSTDKNQKTTVHVTLKCPKESKQKNSTIVDVFQNDGPLCPVAALKEWAAAATSVANLPYFRLDNGTPLTGAKLNSWLDKTIGKYTDKSIGKFTTHSFRIGIASELAKAGCSDEEIKEAGRWSSRAFEAYIRLKRTKRSTVAKEIRKITNSTE
jgi:hypothetical protein